jgi:hypothetical protein
MKTKILFIIAFTVVALSASAQWTTSGSNIYNSNTGNVGIGNTSPDSKLVITRNNWQLKLTNPNSGSWDWRIGSSSSDWFSGGQRFVISHTVNSQDATFCIDGSTSSFNVGIGNLSPSYKLDVNGTIRAFSLIQTSDQRLKENIKLIDGALSKISSLDGVSYTFNPSKLASRTLPEGEQIGILAQQVQKIYPNLVSEDSDGYLSVDYLSLIPLLIEGIKELNTQIEELKTDQVNEKATQLSVQEQELVKGSYLQNLPNPFQETVRFEYKIPMYVKFASINFYDLNGKSISELEVSNRGNGSFETRIDLEPGLYVYSLILDGRPVITKKMIRSSR